MQFASSLPFHEAVSVAGCIILASYPLTTRLSTKVLHKAMQKNRKIYFACYFLLYTIFLTLLFLLVFRGFSYLESQQVFPASTIFSDGDTLAEDIPGSVIAALFFNFGFCGLRFYEENLRLQKVLLESRLQILQAQITPHFMFNVLNHIHVLMQKDVETASELLLNYSDILRYQLYGSKKEWVLLEDEVTFLRNYIEVEKVRWKGKIDIVCHWKVREGKCKISPLLFIPFVENAFKHVSRTVTERGYVHISLLQAGNSVEFTVENSKYSGKRSLTEESGIGLENIRQRLDLLYAGKYKLVILNEEKIYTSQLFIYS